MAYWNGCGGWDRDRDIRVEDVNVNRQRQAQAQAQAQESELEAELKSKSVFKEIGNVHIKIENDNIAVLALVLLGFLDGTMDGTTARSYLERLLARPSVSQS